jgi:hypothetical protein
MIKTMPNIYTRFNKVMGNANENSIREFTNNLSPSELNAAKSVYKMLNYVDSGKITDFNAVKKIIEELKNSKDSKKEYIINLLFPEKAVSPILPFKTTLNLVLVKKSGEFSITPSSKGFFAVQFIPSTLQTVNNAGINSGSGNDIYVFDQNNDISGGYQLDLDNYQSFSNAAVVATTYPEKISVTDTLFTQYVVIGAKIVITYTGSIQDKTGEIICASTLSDLSENNVDKSLLEHNYIRNAPDTVSTNRGLDPIAAIYIPPDNSYNEFRKPGSLKANSTSRISIIGRNFNASLSNSAINVKVYKTFVAIPSPQHYSDFIKHKPDIIDDRDVKDTINDLPKCFECDKTDEIFNKIDNDGIDINEISEITGKCCKVVVEDIGSGKFQKIVCFDDVEGECEGFNDDIDMYNNCQQFKDQIEKLKDTLEIDKEIKCQDYIKELQILKETNEQNTSNIIALRNERDKLVTLNSNLELKLSQARNTCSTDVKECMNKLEMEQDKNSSFSISDRNIKEENNKLKDALNEVKIKVSKLELEISKKREDILHSRNQISILEKENEDLKRKNIECKNNDNKANKIIEEKTVSKPLEEFENVLKESKNKEYKYSLLDEDFMINNMLGKKREKI